MGALAPSSASSSSSFTLPALSPSIDNWFLSSASDHLLVEALARELHSASTSSSSPSGPSAEANPFAMKAAAPSDHQSNNDFLHLQQAQSTLSQVGSPPLSCDSVSKGQPESPFNYTSSTNSVFGVGNMGSMSHKEEFSQSSITTQHCEAPLKGGFNKAASSLAQAPSVALSSQACAGAVASKVSKRRSRSNKKAPIAVLSADTSNFRAMVQQLTGIPTPQTFPNLWATAPDVPLFKPQPTRISHLELPTLDTSSSFLPHKMNPLLQTSHRALPGLIASELSALQGKGKPLVGSSYHSNKFSFDALLSSADAMASCSSPWDTLVSSSSEDGFARGNWRHAPAANMGQEGRNSTAQTLSTSLESFLMGEEDQYLKVSYNTVDSWLAFDGGSGIATHSPKVDVAKIAS